MSRPFFFNQVASIRLRVPLRVFGSVTLEQDFNMASGVIEGFGRCVLPVVHNGAPVARQQTAAWPWLQIRVPSGVKSSGRICFLWRTF